MDEQRQKLEQNFLRVQRLMLDKADKNRDLDEAMGDTDNARKEQIKIETLKLGLELFERVKQENNLEQLVNSFMKLLEAEKAKLEEAIIQARAKEDTRGMIENQIRLGILTGPIEGGFKPLLKQVQT